MSERRRAPARLPVVSFTFLMSLAGSCAFANSHHTTPTPIPPDMQAEKAKVVPMPASLGVKHVLLVVLENGDPEDAEGGTMKFLPFLASTGAVLDHYFGVTHPSQPNYIAMVSGSIDGVTRGDEPVTVDRDHLGRVLGDRWKAYVESYPAPSGTCFLGDRSGGPGGYARKHVPFLSFLDVQTGGCRNIVAEDEHLTKLGADVKNGQLPDFALLIPNLKHDGHAPSNMHIADAWLERNLHRLLKDHPDKVKDLVLIVTFDEDDHDDAAHPNRVFTVFWGDHVEHRRVTDAAYDHYDLLATIEALLRVQRPSVPEGSRPIGGIWR